MSTYWQERESLGYYVLVHAWLSMLSPGDAILDVGCHLTPVVTWGAFAERFTCDIEYDPMIPGVQSHRGNFLNYITPSHLTVVTCLQVLEHLPDEDIPSFTRKLLSCADHTIVSVPYEWPKGDEPAHLQDPISQEKFERMMGRPPLEQVIVHDGRRLRVVGRWVNI